MAIQSQERKRGGCLTIFLMLMLIANPLTGLSYLLAGATITQVLPNVPQWGILLLALLSFANFGFALTIWKWKKWGVYGFAGSSLVTFVFNVLTLGLVGGLFSLLGLGISILILAVLLRPVWSTMESSRLDQWVFSSPQRGAFVVIVFLALLTVGGTGAYVVLGLHPLDPAAAKQADDRAKSEMFGGKADQGIADYTKAIESDPNNAKYYLDRGNAYDIKSMTDKGALDLAIADYTKAIGLVDVTNSSFGLPMPPEQFTALLYDYRGVDYNKKGDYDQAIADFSKAIDVYPTLSYPYIHRGVAYRQHGDFDQAIADFTKDMTLEPTWGHDYYDRGLAYQGKGENAQAVADFQKYLQLAPNASDRDKVQQLINQLSSQTPILQSESTKLVGTWQTNVLERGISVTITWQARSDGTESYQFTSSSGTDEAFGTWQYSDGVLYERGSNGGSGKGALRWIDNDNFELTILDNGVPADTGLKRYYRRN